MPLSNVARGSYARAMEFYLGTHEVSWLSRTEVPLFLSRRRFLRRRSLPRARSRWVLDSGGYSEIKERGRWTVTVAQYAAEIRRLHDEVGGLQWVAPQDWMCEPQILSQTGLTVEQHQRRTVDAYLALTDALGPLAPLVAVVLQGWAYGQHRDCIDLYERSGIDITSAPAVGVGSICRRTDTVRVGMILGDLARCGLRLHAFGVKGDALVANASVLSSADSMSWSFAARRESGLSGCPHVRCSNCLDYALDWRCRLLDRVERETRTRDGARGVDGPASHSKATAW